MASHAEISEQIRFDLLSNEEVVRAFEFLLRDGDPVSQLGAIEVGLRIVVERPELNTLLLELVEMMQVDDPTGERSRFREFSTLYILVASELSRRQQLAGAPPFYRRLAALAQAAVIQRQTIAAGVGLKDSVLNSVAGEYLAGSLVDLRLEPRRHPTLALPERLQAHFLRRVAKAASRSESDLGTKLSEDLGDLLGPEGLRQAGDAFVLYAPGPLEEAEESRPLPAEFAQAIRAQIRTDGTVAPVDFAALRTSATSFCVDEAQADLAAAALTRSDYRLENVKGRAELVDVLSSLAAVAAVARSKRLADTLRVMVRSYRQDAVFPVTLLEAAQILLVGAASRADLADWADFVGDCLTDFAFGELTEDDGETLHDFVRRLCELAPELWATCGRADAALMAFNGLGPRAPTGGVKHSRS